jgi:hypothetical protein
MKRFILAVVFLGAILSAKASHIVGGEFELIHISGNLYRVNFIQYFDLKNGNPQAKDQSVQAFIFRKFDNVLMQAIDLPLTSETPVEYTQPACSIGGIATSKIVYSTTIFLSSNDYNHEDGYYLSWERCCRNYNNTSGVKLINVFSIDPTGNPNTQDFAGQTFYLEFPPVVKNGEPFINSSPQLFPPLSDYACMGKPYYKDFQGIDVDGDSLVYSMVTPLNTNTAEALPGPHPAPYPVVRWIPPYGLNNIIGGHPDLKISQDGLLTTTPGYREGLFVFAIKCEEFRDGVKIGEVRRDFQIFVLDCGKAVPPKIIGKKLEDAAFTYKDNMNVSFPNTVPDDERCIEVKVSDADVFTDGSENIKIRAVAIGFRKKDLSGILPAVTSVKLTEEDSTKVFRICFDRCPYLENGPFTVGIIAGDDACSLPLLDTLRVTVNIQKPKNTPAYFITPNVTASVPESADQVYTWPVEGRDDDLDPIVVKMIGDGFSPEDEGMSIEQVQQENGKYSAVVKWLPDCSVFDFTQQTDFSLKILIDDLDECGFDKPDTMTFKLHIELPTNTKPTIDASLTPIEKLSGVDRKIYTTLAFNVWGTDNEKDYLELVGEGVNFSLGTYNATFPGGAANAFISSPFNWPLNCVNVNLNQKSQFAFRFIVKDEKNKCRFKYADTLLITVRVHPPDNNKPVFTVANLSQDIKLENGSISALIGQTISLDFKSVDADVNPVDKVKIQLMKAEGNVKPTGYSFENREALGTVESPFTWKLGCDIFEGANFVNDYTFRFRTIDNRCYSAKGDTIDLAIHVEDVKSDHADFLPSNIITPNNDGCNDYFAVEGFDEAGELCVGKAGHSTKLPIDNCRGVFSSIRIYNRWGKIVFESTRRDFRWYAPNESPGIFFYTILFTNPGNVLKDIEYKGSITVMY